MEIERPSHESMSWTFVCEKTRWEFQRGSKEKLLSLLGLEEKLFGPFVTPVGHLLQFNSNKDNKDN
jgi:hypothetical protein